MEKQIITFSANEQCLQKTGGIDCYASNIVSYIEAQFELGDNWSGYDSVRAVWFTDFVGGISTVLDSLGTCIVPYEVLTRKGEVKVNLVGSISNGEELTDRLTTCPVTAVAVKCNAKVTGANSTPITPSEYEQFVQNVKADADRAEAGATAAEQSAQSASASATASANSASDSAQSAIASAQSAQNASESAITAENAKDDAEDARDKILSMRATAETLEAGSDATASYSDGLLTLGIPRGDKGEQGIQGETGATPNLTIGTVETLEPTEDATATITGTAENPVLNLGIPKGDTGEVSLGDLEALLPTDTASGDIVSIPDGQSVVPVKSLKVTLEPIQSGSGTPSPDNVRPISGHTECVTEVCGVNVFDKTTALGGYIDDANGQLSGSEPYKSTDYIPVDGGNSYYIVSEQTSAMWGAWYDENKTYIGALTGYANAVKTAPNNASFARLTIKSSASGNVDTFAVNYPSTDHDYHAYNGTSYTTDLGRTVYGGTLDVVSGELAVDRAMVNLGSLNWIYRSNLGGMSAALSPTAKDQFKAVCSIYPYGGAYYELADKQFGYVYDNQIFVKDSDYTDEVAFKTAMNGVQLVYELATPQTYQLTPQEVTLLLGNNNVWSDGGVTLVYNADIQRYIEKKLQS